ncbi:MAG: stage II sporulation protein D [Thermus sp.]|uniref:SpoIID/LytB domain-containing protein n=1 Tax=Thermus sp. TaxID=275 RepID=UPI00331D6066
MRGLILLPLLAVGILALKGLPSWGQRPAEVWVRVLLKEAKEPVVVKTPEGEVSLRRSLPGGVWAEGKVVESLVLEGPFRLDGRSYRGSLWVLPSMSGLFLINALPLEEYLLGVLPGEMPGGFPQEALMAQAVLARTYAVHRLNPQAPYDLCATELCQVYGGMGVETPVHRRAVEATSGQVVSLPAGPGVHQAISALYHSDSGGMTAGSEEVYGRFVPYLRPRPDPFSPKRAWEVRVSWRSLLGVWPSGPKQPRQGNTKGLSEALSVPSSEEEAFALLKRSESGRAYRIRVWGREMEGPEATRFLRALGLPSTLIEEVQAGPEGLTIRGRGAGHGLGLSQWGARGMAEAGYGYREILGYYFPGTFLSNLAAR